MEGHVTLKELDTYWTVSDLQEYHAAMSIKDKFKSGLLNTIAGSLS